MTHYVYNLVSLLSGATKCSVLCHHTYQLENNVNGQKYVFSIDLLNEAINVLILKTIE